MVNTYRALQKVWPPADSNGNRIVELSDPLSVLGGSVGFPSGETIGDVLQDSKTGIADAIFSLQHLGQ